MDVSRKTNPNSSQTKENKSMNAKVCEILDYVGLVTIIIAIISAILWVWIPPVGSRLFASCAILFIGTLILYFFIDNSKKSNKW
jgi:hypothetical protein